MSSAESLREACRSRRRQSLDWKTVCCQRRRRWGHSRWNWRSAVGCECLQVANLGGVVRQVVERIDDCRALNRQREVPTVVKGRLPCSVSSAKVDRPRPPSSERARTFAKRRYTVERGRPTVRMGSAGRSMAVATFAVRWNVKNRSAVPSTVEKKRFCRRQEACRATRSQKTACRT